MNRYWIVCVLMAFLFGLVPDVLGQTSRPAPTSARKKAPKARKAVSPKARKKVKARIRKVVGSNKSPTSRPVARRGKPAKRAAYRCRNRPKYGQFCLGRVIGPRFITQVIRCPHSGESLTVKRLVKPWKPATYDSDLRPHFGHFKHKERV